MQTSDFRYFITSITILSTGSPSIDTSKNTEGFFFSLISPRFKDAGEKRKEKRRKAQSTYIYCNTLHETNNPFLIFGYVSHHLILICKTYQIVTQKSQHPIFSTIISQLSSRIYILYNFPIHIDSSGNELQLSWHFLLS